MYIQTNARRFKRVWVKKEKQQSSGLLPYWKIKQDT